MLCLIRIQLGDILRRCFAVNRLTLVEYDALLIGTPSHPLKGSLSVVSCFSLRTPYNTRIISVREEVGKIYSAAVVAVADLI